MIAKVVKILDEELLFDNGLKLYSSHESECCENHYLSFKDLDIRDFDDLEFDLSSESFFNRIPDYGIELIPIVGHSVKVPGYGYNNGYYSSNLSLCLSGTIDGKEVFYEWRIDDCQTITE